MSQQETASSRHSDLQVQATFAGGLAEHLQAAGGVNAGIASSLRESIGQAHAVANTLSQDMRHGYDSLVELARTELKGTRYHFGAFFFQTDHVKFLF